jgi:hypothetical protein
VTKGRSFRLRQAAAYLLCAAVLWRYGFSSEGTEFAFGRLTGPLLNMKDIGTVLFLLALMLVFRFRRVAAVFGLLATVLCLPLLFYFVAPGPFRWLFKGEYTAPLTTNFVWDGWTMVGIAVVLMAAYLSIRAFSLADDARTRNSV